MAKLGYSVVNVGERDLALGYEEFEKKTLGLPLHFISTNIVRQDTREPVFQPYAIVEIARPGGATPLRVGVLGAVRFSPVWLKQGPEGSSLVTAPPREAVQKVLDEVRSRADVVVLLAALAGRDAHRLAREIPGVDFVFGAHGGALSSLEESEGSTRITYVGNQGKNVGETRVFFGEGPAPALRSDTYVHGLSAKYPDDPELRTFVESALAKAKAAIDPGASGGASGKVAGSGSPGDSAQRKPLAPAPSER